MNCDASSLIVDSQFSPIPACSPFAPVGHITNCSQLAIECYDGFITSPPTNRGNANNSNTIFVGGIVNNIDFEECAQRVVGQDGKFERAYISNEGCDLTLPASTQNTTNVTTTSSTASSNAGSSGFKRKKSIKSGAAMVTYFAILVSLLSAIGMVGAVPSNAAGHEGEVSLSTHSLYRRDAIDCQSFNLASSQQNLSVSTSTWLSKLVDCRNSTTPCHIPVQNYTATVNSSWIFNTTNFVGNNQGGKNNLTLLQSPVPVQKFVGSGYVSSLSASVKGPFYVKPGQQGYLAAHALMNYFEGTMSGCPDGRNDSIQINAVRNERMRFSVVNYTG